MISAAWETMRRIFEKTSSDGLCRQEHVLWVLREVGLGWGHVREDCPQ